MPRVRVAPDDVAAAERTLGSLPSDVAAFLLHANGWKDVYFDLDLLGVEDLMLGADAAAIDPVVESYVEFDALPVSPHALLLVGSSSTISDRVFVVREEVTGFAVGTVLWLDEESREVYASFVEFVASLVAEHRRYLEKITA